MQNMVETPKTEREKAKADLLRWLKPGSTVYTILRGVSRSGMQRKISVVVFVDGTPLHPNYSTGKLLGYSHAKGFNDSLRVNGCGMDMGLHLVSSLAQVLFKDPKALKHEWL